MNTLCINPPLKIDPCKFFFLLNDVLLNLTTMASLVFFVLYVHHYYIMFLCRHSWFDLFMELYDAKKYKLTPSLCLIIYVLQLLF